MGTYQNTRCLFFALKLFQFSNSRHSVRRRSLPFAPCLLVVNPKKLLVAVFLNGFAIRACRRYSHRLVPSHFCWKILKWPARGSPFFNGFPIIGKFDLLTAHSKTPQYGVSFFLIKCIITSCLIIFSSIWMAR